MLNSSSTSKNRTTVRSKNAVRLTKAALQTAFVVSDDLGASLAERLFTSARRHKRPDRERAVLTTAREGRVTVALRSPRHQGTHITIPTWRWGFGPTVLLVHGWEGRGSQLGAFVAPLVKAGLSVVTFDAPGHGNAPDHRLYLTDLADTVADVAAAVGPLHGIVAHSFGAAAVLLAGVRNALECSRFVMVAPNVIIDDSVRRFAHLVGLDEADRLAFVQRIVDHSGVSLEALSLERLTAGHDERLLVIHDRSDREVPIGHGERLASLWPGSQFIATDELGHRRILRDDATIAASVAMLADGVPPPVSDLVREVDRQLEEIL